jgi:hypothetical protein
MRSKFGKKTIGAFGIFAAWLPVDWDRFEGNWLALEQLAFDAHWWAGIYSAYDLIRWGRDTKLIRLSEYEAWFNMLQN